MLPFLGERRITILTDGLTLAYHLSRYPNISVVVLGGLLRHDEMSLLGPLAERALAEFHLDAVFSSAFGIDPHSGLSGANVTEGDTDRRMLQSGPLTILADSSKFGRRCPVRLLGVEGIQHLVTDSAAPAATLENIRRHGVEVVTC